MADILDLETFGGSQFGKTNPPLWTVKHKKGKDKNYLEWLKNEYNQRMVDNARRASVQFRNSLLYEGLQYTGMFSSIRGDEALMPSTLPKGFSPVNVNELFDTVQQRSAKLSQFNITTIPIPHSNEHSDREGAKVVEQLFETIKYNNNMRRLYREMVEDAVVFAYSFILTLWDKDRSNIDERWLAAKKKAGDKKFKIELEGEVYNQDEPRRIGDIRYSRPLPWSVILDDGGLGPEDCMHMILPKWVHIDEVKFDYPKLASKITAESNAMYFDVDTYSSRKLADHVLVLEVFARNSRFLNDGLYFKATPSVMLEPPTESPYPRFEASPWGNLPIEWLTDIDLRRKFYPISSFQILGPLQHLENQIFSKFKENIMLNMHPKMLIPKQSGMQQVLANSAMNYIYNAPFKPELMSMNSIPPEGFKIAELVAGKITQLQGLQGISKGEIGPNIRSGKQISLLQELESVRSTPVTQKKNDLVVAVDKKTLSIIGKFYRENDKRLLFILGKDKKFLVESFKHSVLNKSYDVRMLQADAFPESPSARLEVIDNLTQNPNFFSLLEPEQWAQIADLKAPERFNDIVTVSVNKAEWENVQFIEGKTPPLPTDEDDHIIHWRVLMTVMRGQNFLKFSKKVQEAMRDHLLVHEDIMMRTLRVHQNPVYAEKLAKLEAFPVSFTNPDPELSAEQQAQAQQAQAPQAPQTGGQ